jgi:hypothetical protein
MAKNPKTFPVKNMCHDGKLREFQIFCYGRAADISSEKQLRKGLQQAIDKYLNSKTYGYPQYGAALQKKFDAGKFFEIMDIFGVRYIHVGDGKLVQS